MADGRRLVVRPMVPPTPTAKFGLAVDADWRGWLGSYLLDSLLRAAAERGVPNLDADILLDNLPMSVNVSPSALSVR